MKNIATSLKISLLSNQEEVQEPCCICYSLFPLNKYSEPLKKKVIPFTQKLKEMLFVINT